MQSDDDLLEAWSRGDERAGKALFDRHGQALLRFFATKVGDDVAVDLVQQTLLRFLQSLGKFDPHRGTFRGWLFGHARIQLLRHFDETARGQRIRPLETTLNGLQPSPSWLVAKREQAASVISALRRIPIDYQITVELFYWEGLAVKEIAQVLEASEGAIKTRLHRGRHMLREQLEDLGVHGAEAGMFPARPDHEQAR